MYCSSPESAKHSEFSINDMLENDEFPSNVTYFYDLHNVTKWAVPSAHSYCEFVSL